MKSRALFLAFVLVVATLAFPRRAAAAPAFVQANTAICTGGFPNGTCAYPSNAGAGHTGILVMQCSSACSPTFADTQLKTWTIVVGPYTGVASGAVYVVEADNLNAAADTLTITVGSFTYRAWMLEYSGLSASALDKTASTTGSSGSASSGATAATTQASELILDIFQGGAAITTTDGTTIRKAEAVSQFLTVSDKNVAATGAQTATGTLSFNSWSAGVATFKASGGGGASIGCDMSQTCH